MFGSLANTLLDLGLPRIRGWIRERLGDSADVAAVTTEGGFVHLDGVVLPIGPRGLVSLERATAAIGRKAQREADLPEARLHAFRGVVRFGTTGEASFVADVAFKAEPHPDEAAWIAGELVIDRATWTPAPGMVEARAMRGSAKLFVTSTEWRLDDGVLESERARVRFTGRGALDSSTTGGGIAAAALALDEAKVGAFLDAASAILGRTIAVPPGVPIDAGITGQLSFSAEGGGRGELAIDAEGLEVRVDGSVASDGTDLDVNVGARARPSVAMRNARLPAKVLPRDEDELVLDLKVTGVATAPMVKGTMRSPEIAFRAGRPRFAPPAAVVHDVVVELASEGDQALARMTARAGAGTLTAHLDVPVREPRKSHAQVWIKDLDAAWVSALLGAVDARIALPRDAHASVDLRLTADTADGEASIVTPRSRIAVAPFVMRTNDGDRRLDGTHIEGDVAFEDALTLGLESLAVRPTKDGSLLLSLDLTGSAASPEARGTAGAKRLSLVTDAREGVVVDLLDVRGPVMLTRAALDFTELRGQHADGTLKVVARVPFVRGQASHATFEIDGGSATIVSLLRFAPRAVSVPDGAKIAGVVAVGGESVVSADMNLLSAAARTSLAVHLALSHERRLDGTTVRGHLDLADVPAPLPARGTIDVDALVGGTVDEPFAAGMITSDLLDLGPAAITSVSALFRVDRAKAVWHELEAMAYGGVVASAGVFRRSGRAIVTKIGVRDVAIENLPLGTEAPVVMGRLSASLRVDGSLSAPQGRGRVVLDEPFYPVLVRTREALGKYGLEPPHARGDAPATADVVVEPGGIALRSLRASVPGCSATGDVRVARDGGLEGHVSIIVDKEYLGTSAVLVIPAVLTERLTIPVKVRGTLREPVIDADLAGAFGSFMTENRVSTFVNDAVEEMSSLFGARPARTRPPAAPDPIERGPKGDEDLVAELDAARPAWRELEPRLAEHRARSRRVRVGS